MTTIYSNLYLMSPSTIVLLFLASASFGSAVTFLMMCLLQGRQKENPFKEKDDTEGGSAV
jgi:hypothetical protein